MSCQPEVRVQVVFAAPKSSRLAAVVILATAWPCFAGGHAAEALLPRDNALPQSSSTLWAISSRHADHEAWQDPSLEYWRYDEAAATWTAALPEGFLAEDQPGVVTLFYVHGNQIDHQQALYDGQQVFRQLCTGLPAGKSLRVVIWSWPSSKVEGPLKDCRSKAGVSDAHAWHLAWLVDRMRPEVPISLVGYSFGARLVSGALHLLGGGRLAGQALAERLHPARLPLRAVLMAGALDSHALFPNGRNHRALSQVERMLVLVNPRDRVLLHYPLIKGLFRAGPPALGYTGFFSRSLGPEFGKVAQWNVSSYVGKEHDWRGYLYSPAIVSRLQSYALFAD